MKQGSTLILKATIITIALLVLAICTIVFPVGIRAEGLVGYGLILLGMYVTAIPFFIALYQGFNLLNYIDKNQAFSEKSVAALNKIKQCAIIITALYAAGMPYIYIVADQDDAPGVIVIGLVIIFTSTLIATFSGVLQKLLQNVIDIKSENDLTV